MSTQLVDVRQVIGKLYSTLIKKDGGGSAAALADWLVGAEAFVSGGSAVVQFADCSALVFKPASLFGVATADGIIITDFTLFLRSVCLALIGSAIGKKMQQDPVAMAEIVQAATVRFFSGGSTGGAVYEDGHWEISPTWLPMLQPQAVAAISSTIDSPIARTLATLSDSDDAAAEDLQKALRVGADVNFSLTAVGGTQMLTLALGAVTRKRVADVQAWKPTLVYSGNPSDDDVVTRAGTFAPDSDHADWRSDAFEALATTGFVLGSLQVPRLFSDVSILRRIVYEDEGVDPDVVSVPWFTGVEKDWKLTGAPEAMRDAILANQLGYKVGWLDELRGFPVPNAVSATAYMCSPLAYTAMVGDFIPSLDRAQSELIELTDARRALVRSQPEMTPELLWLANTTCTSLRKSWIDAYDTSLFAALKEI